MSSETIEAPEGSPSLPSWVFLRKPAHALARGARRLIGRVGIDLLFVLLMTFILGTTLLTLGASLRIAQASVYLPIGMMFFLMITRGGLWLYRHPRQGNEDLSLGVMIVHTLRDWIPFILIDFIYENLHDLSRYFHTHDVAGLLMQWDIGIFGVEPTLWSQRFFHPLLTDFMAFAYALYVLFPLLIMYFLSYRNKRFELHEVILALSFCFLIGFLGYVFFPCSPPRYFLEGSFTEPARLSGLFLYDRLQSRWDSLSVIRAGAFPSLHVALSSIGLIYAFRFRRWSRGDRFLFRLFLPFVISLWISTIYLRHHWFIDILAGWALALLSCWLAPALTRWWDDLRKDAGYPSFASPKD